MQKEIIFSLMAGTLICVGLLVFGGFAAVEPSETQAAVSSATTSVSLTVTEEISLTAPSAITMTPAISMSNSTSTGGGNWNVKTNSQAGYTLALKAEQTNTLRDGSTSEYFTDCATTTPGVWTTVCENANNFIFGFSAYGSAVPTATWGTGSNCTSTPIAANNLKYRGFASTTDIQIASASSETGQSGVNSAMCVAATQGISVYAPDGSYTTIITGTATTQ